MNTRNFRLSLLLGCFCMGSVLFSGSVLAQRGTDFALLDQDGRFHQLSRYNESEAVVVYVQGLNDAISSQGYPLLQDLQTRYAGQGVVFFMLNAARDSTREAVQAELAQHGLDIPVLLDTAQLVARSLGVKTTAEAFILDPSSHGILYRGPLDSRIAVEGADPQLQCPISKAL
jgi:peroxiredoxin